MNVLDLLHGQVDNDVITKLSQQIGANSPDQTESAVSGIFSTLVAALAKNAQKPGGTAALVSAVDRDHDGSLLDDIPGFLFGNRQTSNAKTLNGSGILGHILGNNQSNVTDMLGKMSGLNNSQIGKLMITLAPLVLAVIGKARNKQNLDTGGIGDLLKNSAQRPDQEEQGLLERFLDSNGDGQVMDDILNMGKKFFTRR